MTVGECPRHYGAGGKNTREQTPARLNMVFQFEHTSLTDGKYGKWAQTAQIW